MISNIEKFDGTNWAIWSFEIRAALMFMNSWSIADGTETRPANLPDNVMTANILTRQAEQKDWDKRNRQGRSLLALTVKPSIYHSICLEETLAQNWTRLSNIYGRRTALQTWLDFRTYITTVFDETSPIPTQIDALSQLRVKMVEDGLIIPENFHALVALGALPASYEAVRSSILNSYTSLAQASIMDIHARLLAEELQQGSSSTIHAIHRPDMKPKAKHNSKSTRD